MKSLQDVQKISDNSISKAPVVFQGFWHGPPLGHLRNACLQSFVRMGYTFELYTYQHLNVPDGIILKNAEEIIPFDQVFYYDNPRSGSKDLGPFSDLFRFKLLSERGGWWTDVDTICLSPHIPNIDEAWAQELPELNSRAIGTSQIAMSKGHPLAVELYSRCLKLSRTNFQPREALGPHLLSSTIHELGYPKNIFGSANAFYPIRWIEMFKLWLPQFRDEVKFRSQNSFFMPIYQSFPQYIGLALDKLPPRESYLGEICRAYLPHLEEAERYLEEEILEGAKMFFQKNREWAIDELKAVSGDETLTKLGLADNES